MKHLTQPLPTKWNRRFPALLGTAVVGLSACMQNPTEVDPVDYSQIPITAETAGQSLAASFASTQDWDKTSGPSADLQVMESVFGSTSTLKAQTGLPKMSVKSAEDLVIEIDSAAGLAHLTHTTQILGVTSVEKADVLWDAQAKDDIKDNEHIVRFSVQKTHLLGKVESAVFVDADGDGMINAVKPQSKVQITFEKTEAGQTETAVLVVGCGPDLNFDNDADNQIFQATWNRMRNKVLQAEASFQDGDDDGVVVDNADTSIVVVEMGDLEPLDRPLVKERHAHAKVKLFGKDKGDQPMAFGYTETMKNGRVNTVSMKNRFGKEDLIPNDTMTVRLETVAKREDDTLKTLSLEFVMNPGPDLKSEADDSAYAFHIHSTKHIGLEREAEFHFYADSPVLHGAEPTAGHFDGKATYANGKSATLKGEFSPKGFHAEYIGPEGGTWTVDYTLAGIVIP
jgi:hypothetical protein